VRGTGDQDRSWNLSARWIPGIPVERAELRLTATYQVVPDAFVGLEYNPLADDLGLLANWRVLAEGERRPMVMLGTSSDRIGTPEGRAYYATASRDLERDLGLPLAPYVGVAYGEYDDEWVLIGGAAIRWTERLTSTHVWDSENLHHMLDLSLDGGTRLGVVLAQQGDSYYLGLSTGLGL
jgi:hypothetical protein